MAQNPTVTCKPHFYLALSIRCIWNDMHFLT